MKATLFLDVTYLENGKMDSQLFHCFDFEDCDGASQNKIVGRASMKKLHRLAALPRPQLQPSNRFPAHMKTIVKHLAFYHLSGEFHLESKMCDFKLTQ
jgi:hypothetical protein